MAEVWANAPTVFVTAPYCFHCHSTALLTTRSEANGDGTMTRKAICRRCSKATKVCVELPKDGNDDMATPYYCEVEEKL